MRLCEHMHLFFLKCRSRLYLLILDLDELQTIISILAALKYYLIEPIADYNVFWMLFFRICSSWLWFTIKNLTNTMLSIVFWFGQARLFNLARSLFQ